MEKYLEKIAEYFRKIYRGLNNRVLQRRKLGNLIIQDFENTSFELTWDLKIVHIIFSRKKWSLGKNQYLLLYLKLV